MYLVITRTFPPEVGGMQNLMWGLARSLSKLDMVKVFAVIMKIIKNLMIKFHLQLRELVVLNY